MSSTSPNYSNSKFTKGEKCLFAHVVITFCGIVAIIIGYYGHACLVRHRGNLGIELSLRNSPEISIGMSEYLFNFIDIRRLYLILNHVK